MAVGGSVLHADQHQYSGLVAGVTIPIGNGVMSIPSVMEQFSVAFWADMSDKSINNTPHAFRQICAPWGVTFFKGVCDALYQAPYVVSAAD